MGDSEAPADGLGAAATLGAAAAGFPCYYMLLMKYVTSFLTTFLIYFLVFGYLDYKGIISKIMDFFIQIPEKIFGFLSSLVPNFIKNFFKKFLSPFHNFFSQTIPDYLNKKKEEAKKPLEKRLDELKQKEADILKNKNAKPLFIFSNWLNNALSNVKIAGTTFWEKLKDVVFAGLILSLFYYAIWYLIMVVFVNMIKYALNSAIGGAQMLQQIQGLKAAMAAGGGVVP
jgi:hypothetical protein